MVYECHLILFKHPLRTIDNRRFESSESKQNRDYADMVRGYKTISDLIISIPHSIGIGEKILQQIQTNPRL
jgi:hypothetical protein